MPTQLITRLLSYLQAYSVSYTPIQLVTRLLLNLVRCHFPVCQISAC